MGYKPGLDSFVADDSFMRRIDRKRRVTNDGMVSWEVFKPREGEESLSFTYQNDPLKTEHGLTQYQIDRKMPSGDLAGICKLTFSDLTAILKPPLSPRQEDDNTDSKYGKLHCITDCPGDQIHMEQMAKIATRNGLLRPFIRKKKAEQFIETFTAREKKTN